MLRFHAKKVVCCRLELNHGVFQVLLLAALATWVATRRRILIIVTVRCIRAHVLVQLCVLDQRRGLIITTTTRIVVATPFGFLVWSGSVVCSTGITRSTIRGTSDLIFLLHLTWIASDCSSDSLNHLFYVLVEIIQQCVDFSLSLSTIQFLLFSFRSIHVLIPIDFQILVLIHFLIRLIVLRDCKLGVIIVAHLLLLALLGGLGVIWRGWRCWRRSLFLLLVAVQPRRLATFVCHHSTVIVIVVVIADMSWPIFAMRWASWGHLVTRSTAWFLSTWKMILLL